MRRFSTGWKLFIHIQDSVMRNLNTVDSGIFVHQIERRAQREAIERVG